MKVDDQVMLHEILAAVLRQYGGATLPEEVVVTRPSRFDEAHDTLLVSERMDGLHIKIISPPPVDAGPPRRESATGFTPATDHTAGRRWRGRR